MEVTNDVATPKNLQMNDESNMYGIMRNLKATY